MTEQDEDAVRKFKDRIADGYEVKNGGVWVKSPTNPDIDITVTTPDDPAQALLQNPDVYSTPVVYWPTCYICNDPEFAQMGMPLCRECPDCDNGHVPADDISCDNCGSSREYDEYMSSRPVNDGFTEHFTDTDSWL